MNKPLKIKYQGQVVSEIEFLKEIAKEADGYSKETKKFFLEMTKEALNTQRAKEKQNSLFLPWFGVGLLIVILVITIFIPFPTLFQSGVWWVAFSLGTAACAALIPGFIEFKYQTYIKASGAIAVFCMMYFYLPAIMNAPKFSEKSKINLYVVRSDEKGVDKITADFDKNSHENICNSITKTLSLYWGVRSNQTDFTFFRKTDGMIYSVEECVDISDYEVLIIPKAIVEKFPNKRDAFLKFKSTTTH